MGTSKKAAAGDEPATASSPAVVPAFDRIASVLRGEGSVDAPPAGGRRAFGAEALKLRRKIFAMPVQGRWF